VDTRSVRHKKKQEANLLRRASSKAALQRGGSARNDFLSSPRSICWNDWRLVLLGENKGQMWLLFSINKTFH